jgi:acetylornithine deacetylase/succinyl-diaminopimelate desuccinylase-like protein
MTAEIAARVIRRAVEVQQIPAPTFQEHDRAAFVRDGFLQERLSDVELDQDGNLFARLPGADPQALFLVVSAHTDTVFPHSTDLSITESPDRIAGPGIGDNSLGVAGLFGLVWLLRARGITLPGDLWLVANMGEEGLGDLAGMKQVYQRFSDQPVGYLVLEGLALGRIYHRGLGVRRYRISVKTPGGHSWVDYGSPSAIHELALLSNQILALRTPYRKRTTINIGRISGGVSINTIAPAAELDLDLRSESNRILSSLARKVEDLVRFAQRPGVEFTIEQIGNRPFGEIPADHPLVAAAAAALSARGYRPDLQIGSTDANIPLSHGVPAVCIGLTTGGGAHTSGEYMDTQPLAAGLEQLLDLVVRAYRL